MSFPDAPPPYLGADGKWTMRWQATCDGCKAVEVIDTIVDQPDEHAARRQMREALAAKGWQIGRFDNCPNCRSQGGYTPTPPTPQSHHVEYAGGEASVTARCGCGWEATSPGMVGAQTAAQAHLTDDAGPAQQPSTAKEWWR